MNARIEKYLSAYNLLQSVLWLFALLILPVNYVYAFYIICIAQVCSVAEVYHALRKWNNSPAFLSFAQITARLLILYFTGMLFLATAYRAAPYFKVIIRTMFLVWCIAEIIRYTYYTVQINKYQHYRLTWLRYSAFIICYPVGLLCELYIMYLVFKFDELWQIKLLVILMLTAYFFLFPKLYLHLLNQRKQKLFYQ